MAQQLRLPPKIKILEALSAIVDGRVSVEGGRAVVVSSDGSRRYRVYVDVERGLAYSDDNGTLRRGYIGYPIIAVLMVKGYLEVDWDLARALRGVPWRKLNEEMKSYDRVMAEVRRIVAERGVDPSRIDGYVARAYNQLSKIRLRLSKV